VDFYLGYSPERINPGDPTRKLPDIKKIVAGSTPAVTDFLEQLYSRVVKAGLFKAASIRVAEAAKILENTQRDVNIALMNQMMALFDKMGVRSTDVIAAAGSKWNFHHYRPGLVGGVNPLIYIKLEACGSGPADCPVIENDLHLDGDANNPQ
jgi:UDP-N-acetyl-D-galactosamine dehydrogenase